MSDLAALRERVQRDLDDAGNAVWATDDIDSAIKRALEDYSVAARSSTMTAGAQDVVVLGAGAHGALQHARAAVGEAGMSGDTAEHWTTWGANRMKAFANALRAVNRGAGVWGVHQGVEGPSDVKRRGRADRGTGGERERTGTHQASRPHAARPAAVPASAAARVRPTTRPVRPTLGAPYTRGEVDSACEKHDIRCFYHITHLDNLASILADGILCRNRIEKYRDISNLQIQDHRHRKTLSQNDHVTLHDCVPMFVASKPPMLSALRDQQEHLVYLHIDPAVLSLPGVEFTDGNARSNDTCFFCRPEDLDRLDWSVLRATYWGDEDEEKHRENKRLRSAEVLVPDQVPVDHILSITVMTLDARDQVARIVRVAKRPVPLQVDSSMYYPPGSHEPPETMSANGVVPEVPPSWDDEIPF